MHGIVELKIGFVVFIFHQYLKQINTINKKCLVNILVVLEHSVIFFYMNIAKDHFQSNMIFENLSLWSWRWSWEQSRELKLMIFHCNENLEYFLMTVLRKRYTSQGISFYNKVQISNALLYA